MAEDTRSCIINFGNNTPIRWSSGLFFVSCLVIYEYDQSTLKRLFNFAASVTAKRVKIVLAAAICALVTIMIYGVVQNE